MSTCAPIQFLHSIWILLYLAPASHILFCLAGNRAAIGALWTPVVLVSRYSIVIDASAHSNVSAAFTVQRERDLMPSMNGYKRFSIY